MINILMLDIDGSSLVGASPHGESGTPLRQEIHRLRQAGWKIVVNTGRGPLECGYRWIGYEADFYISEYGGRVWRKNAFLPNRLGKDFDGIEGSLVGQSAIKEALTGASEKLHYVGFFDRQGRGHFHVMDGSDPLQSVTGGQYQTAIHYQRIDPWLENARALKPFHVFGRDAEGHYAFSLQEACERAEGKVLGTQRMLQLPEFAGCEAQIVYVGNDEADMAMRSQVDRFLAVGPHEGARAVATNHINSPLELAGWLQQLR